MSKVTELENEIKELETRRLELLKKLEVEKIVETEIQYPFEVSEYYYYLNASRDILKNRWNNDYFEHKAYTQGNVFKTAEEAERERDRRDLLKRFRQFRDKCNGDWKPDFSQLQDDKYSIQFNYNLGALTIYNSGYLDGFRLFGYFKNDIACERAIELFGDEIKRLFLEEE